MNALEEFEIYRAYANISSRGSVLNNQLNFKSNLVDDTALNLVYQLVERNNRSAVDITWIGTRIY